VIKSKLLARDFHQTINYFIVAYAFLLPLSRASIVFFSFVLLFLWGINTKNTQKYQMLFKNQVILALFAFLLFNFISLLWASDISQASNYILKYWYFLPMIVIFSTIEKSYIPKVLSAFILGMFISEVISYGVFFEFWEFKHATVQNISPFMHHIEYSIFLAFTALIVLGRAFASIQIKYKTMYSLFFITVTGNLFLTAGRTGQLAFIVGLLVLAFVNFKNKFKAFLIFFVLSVGILGTAFNVSQTFHDRIINAKVNFINAVQNEAYCNSLGARVGAWIIATDIVKHNPLLGVGIIDNMHTFHRRIDEKYTNMKCLHVAFMHMHNQFFQIATQLGIIGLLIFLFLFYSIMRITIQSQEYRNIKYVYLTVLLFAFLPEVLFHRQFSMAFFALIVGLLLAQNRIENEI
jgi:O-antigen ligase